SALTQLGDRIKGSNSWEQFTNTPIINPLQGTAHFVSIHFHNTDNVWNYLSKWRHLQTKQQEFLDTVVNPVLLATSADDSWNRSFTNRLILLAMYRAATEDPKQVW